MTAVRLSHLSRKQWKCVKISHSALQSHHKRLHLIYFKKATAMFEMYQN